MRNPRVYPDHDSHSLYIEYKYVDGPNKGHVAFSIPKNDFEGVEYELLNRVHLGKSHVVFDGFELLENERALNTAVIKASCGQSVTLDLEGIDNNQDIDEVTIRGVRYTPA